MTTVLATAVMARYGTNMLVGLTNDTVGATTINATVLEAAASDATADFERMVMKTFDSADSRHVVIGVIGTIAYLEDYKSRDSSIVSGRMKRFVAACKDMRESQYTPAATNSTLLPKAERTDALPDMDRSQPAFAGGIGGTRIQLISTSPEED